MGLVHVDDAMPASPTAAMMRGLVGLHQYRTDTRFGCLDWVISKPQVLRMSNVCSILTV